MAQLDDMRLVQDFALRGSEEAFTALLDRHIKLVYSVALRYVGDAQKAEDIAQSVFLLLAQKGPRLRRNTLISGWLYRAARLVAIRLRRSEMRREQREQEAVMQSINNPEADPAESPWEELAPLLDDAMDRLGEIERNAVLLRYFEGLPLAQVAAKLDLKEAAVRKQVSRALEKLRHYFAKKGVSVPVGSLAGAIERNALQPVPAGCVAAVAAVGLAKGAGASATVLGLVEATSQLLTWMKAKMTAAMAGAALLAAGTATIAVRELAQPDEPPQLTGTWRIEGEARDLVAPSSATPQMVTKFVITLAGSGGWHAQLLPSQQPSPTSEMDFDGTNLFAAERGFGGTRMMGGRQVGYSDLITLEPGPTRNLSPLLAAMWWGLLSQSVLGQEGEWSGPSFMMPEEEIPSHTRQTLSSRRMRIGLESSDLHIDEAPGRIIARDYTLRTVESGQTNGVLYPKLIRVTSLSPDNTPAAIYEVACSKVEPTEPRRSYRPEFRGPTLIRDMRQRGEMVQYVATNWASIPGNTRLASQQPDATSTHLGLRPMPLPPIRRTRSTPPPLMQVAGSSAPPPPLGRTPSATPWFMLGVAGASSWLARSLFVRLR